MIILSEYNDILLYMIILSYIIAIVACFAISHVGVSCSVMSNSATAWTVALQTPLSMGFSRQEYWSGLPCPPPGDRPNPGIKPGSPALQADTREARYCTYMYSYMHLSFLYGFPRWLNGKESTCQCSRLKFNPWVGEMHWRRKWQPTPVFLPGKSNGQRSPVGYSPWGRKRVRHDSN